MRVLVTGATGFLGSAVVDDLLRSGIDVVPLARLVGPPGISCDLRDRADVFRKLSGVGAFDGVVHLAARAHAVRGIPERQLFEANCVATENLVDALASIQALDTLTFVFASSVAVAGNLEVGGFPSAHPVTAYGRTKLAAEHALARRAFKSLRCLRFAPLFDSTHLADVRKRVFLPLVPFKVLIEPTPLHHLCSLATAVSSVRYALLTPEGGSDLRTVRDDEPISQRTLATWFAGPEVCLPAAPFLALARLVKLIPYGGMSANFLLLKYAAGQGRRP